MTKILFKCLFIFSLPFLLNAFGYEMQCVDNPSEYKPSSSTPSDDEIKSLINLTPEIEQSWVDLNEIVQSDGFKNHGLNDEAFKKWDKNYESLIEEVNKILNTNTYYDTNYEQCETAVLYGLTFQRDFARVSAIYTDEQDLKIIQAKDDVVRYLINLPL